MQLALRSSAIASVAAVGAGLVVVTPVAPKQSSTSSASHRTYNSSSVADVAASSLGGALDAAIQQVETYVLDGGIAIGFPTKIGVAVGSSPPGLGSIGATALGADVSDARERRP